MHDAIALANLIYALPANTSEEITKTFKEYHGERYPPAVEAYNNSLLMSKLLKGGITGAVATFFKNNMPNWLWRLAVRDVGNFYVLEAFFSLGIAHSLTHKTLSFPNNLRSRDSL